MYIAHKHTQLNHKETLQEGAALRLTFPDTETGFIDLQVGHCIEAAVNILKPSQSNHSVEHFYRQQAWKLLQVSASFNPGTCTCAYTCTCRSCIHVFPCIHNA